MKNDEKMLTMQEIDDVEWQTLYKYDNKKTGETRTLLTTTTDQPYFAVVEVKHGKLLMLNVFYGEMMLQDWWAREDYLLEKEANRCFTVEEWEKYDDKAAECWAALHAAQNIVEEKR